jgi:hypothetical protein
MLHIHTGVCNLDYNKDLLSLPFEPDHFYNVVTAYLTNTEQSNA